MHFSDVIFEGLGLNPQDINYQSTFEENWKKTHALISLRGGGTFSFITFYCNVDKECDSSDSLLRKFVM